MCVYIYSFILIPLYCITNSWSLLAFLVCNCTFCQQIWNFNSEPRCQSKRHGVRDAKLWNLRWVAPSESWLGQQPTSKETLRKRGREGGRGGGGEGERERERERARARATPPPSQKKKARIEYVLQFFQWFIHLTTCSRYYGEKVLCSSYLRFVPTAAWSGQSSKSFRLCTSLKSCHRALAAQSQDLLLGMSQGCQIRHQTRTSGLFGFYIWQDGLTSKIFFIKRRKTNAARQHKTEPNSFLTRGQSRPAKDL